eukprot:7383864-Prymnesium_polylepis.4
MVGVPPTAIAGASAACASLIRPFLVPVTISAALPTIEFTDCSGFSSRSIMLGYLQGTASNTSASVSKPRGCAQGLIGLGCLERARTCIAF